MDVDSDIPVPTRNARAGSETTARDTGRVLGSRQRPTGLHALQRQGREKRTGTTPQEGIPRGKRKEKGRLVMGQFDKSMFGRFPKPMISKVSKYDHGEGPKDFTHMGKSVAKSGHSQHPKQAYIKHNGRKGGD